MNTTKCNKIFLSDKPDEGGSLHWYVSDNSCEKSADVTSSMFIRDCARTIELDFGTYTRSNVKDRLVKIDTMIDELYKFKAAYLIVAKEAEATHLEKKGEAEAKKMLKEKGDASV